MSYLYPLPAFINYLSSIRLDVFSGGPNGRNLDIQGTNLWYDIDEPRADVDMKFTG